MTVGGTMTYEEVQKLMKALEAINSCRGITPELLSVAAGKLYKQLPDTLIYQKFSDDPDTPGEAEWLCPSCRMNHAEILEYIRKGKVRYCPYCGQRLFTEISEP